jgi:hypothetical protein
MASPPPSPERLCAVARCDTLPLEQAIEQFPYEQTITIVATKPMARSDAIDLSHALDMFPTEHNLLVSVPAGPPIAYDARAEAEKHRAARVGWVHGMRAIVVAIAAMAVRVLSRMLWPMRLARHVLAAIWRGALDVPGRLRSAAGQFANQAIGVVRSAGRIAIERCRMLRSRAASVVVGARQAVGIRVARALALPARLSFELSRARQSMRGSIDIRLDIARRLAQPLTLRKPTARMTQAWNASGHRSLALGRVAVSTAQRFAVAAVRHVSRPARQDLSPGRSRASTARGMRGWVGRPDKTNTVPSAAALQPARLVGLRRASLEIPLRLRSAAGRFANQAIGVVRSAGRIAIDRCQMLRSRAASLAVEARRAVGIRVARALALPARLSIDLRRALRSMRGSIGIRLDIARRSVQPLTLRKLTARMTQAWKASGHRSLALGRVAVSTAQRFAMAAVIFTVIVTGMFAISGWDVPRAVVPVATRPAPAVSLPPPNDAIAANATDRPSPNPPRREPRPTADPAPRVRRQPPPVASTAAIQRVLNRYRDAHSTLDVSAVTATWPSVDTAALRRSFARLAEHNVEYESCRVSVADTRASAVCRGVTQSVRVGERTTTQESRQWQFALDQVGDRWLITAVDSR